MRCIRMKKTIHYGIIWKVKNSEGRDNGALQYKAWKPGILQLKNDEVNVAYGRQQNIFCDPRETRIGGT